MSFLPYAKHTIDNDDIDAVNRVLNGDWLTCGPSVEAYEAAFSEEVGSKYAIACSSGTAALHLSMLAIGLESHDEVIVPTITFVASANAAKYVNAKVIFSDVCPSNALMSASDLSEALDRSQQAKAVVPVYYAGQTPDIKALYEIAKASNLHIIEDATHALGASYSVRGKSFKVGSCAHSDLCVFSTHPAKTIATGEGGIITTNNESLYKSLLSLRAHGITRNSRDFINGDLAHSPNDELNPWYYEQHLLGYNYRISDINCALGTSQLKKLRTFLDIRQKLFEQYNYIFKESEYIKPIKIEDNCNAGWHLYVVLIDFEKIGISRATLMNELKKYQIGTQVHYIPVHLQPYYRSIDSKLMLPNANKFYGSCLSLPLFPNLSVKNVEYIAQSLSSIIEKLHVC